MEKHRELNPQLFGTSQVTDSMAVHRSETPASVMPRSTGTLPYAPLEQKNLEHQISQITRAVVQLEKRTETIAFKMEELARGVHSRLERFSQTIQRFEESRKHLTHETASRVAAIASKVNERKVSDSKIEEMIERHNSIVRGFEARLLSLQRLVAEQEMALHGAKAAIEEARRK